MDSDPDCTGSPAPDADEAVVVARDPESAERVRLREGRPRQSRFPVPSTAVVLDQKGCRYTPHVLGVQVGQPLGDSEQRPDAAQRARDADSRTASSTQASRSPGMKHTHVFSTREVMVPFKCDVHQWMNAYVGVLSTIRSTP